MENTALFVGRKNSGKGYVAEKVFDIELEKHNENVQITSSTFFSLKYKPIYWSHKTAYYQFQTQIWIHNTSKTDSFLSSPKEDQKRLGNAVDSIIFMLDPFQPETAKEFKQWRRFASENNVGLRLCVCNPTKPANLLSKLYSTNIKKLEEICAQDNWELVDLTQMYEPSSLSFPSTKLIFLKDQLDPDIGLNNYLHIALAFEQHFWSVMYSVYRPDSIGQAGLTPGIRVTTENLGLWIRNDAIAKMNFSIFGITAKKLASYLYSIEGVDYNTYDADWERIVSQFEEKDIFKLCDQLFPDVDANSVVQDPMESIENVIYRLKKIHKKVSQLPDVERRIEAARIAVAYSTQMV
ncbi:hypothetical protein BB561_002089 [Smittium simulii]|uniref:G domain-containing protein n=1 Tax=Smittium simulii TaxID=133385 RepID=A0A2T9YRW4_9FUNG|nr:hypothetical protein BB561_002089 [Smittium simulii]